ncbi:MAG TPA: hypothetical protein VGL20_20325 [Candidatus Dormibacteraeota bacterium]
MRCCTEQDVLEVAVAVVRLELVVACTDSEPVVVVVLVVVVAIVSAREAAGLNSSATKPARTTVAAMAPRRAALIGRTAAERVSGTSPEEVELYRDAVPRRVQSVAPPRPADVTGS